MLEVVDKEKVEKLKEKLKRLKENTDVSKASEEEMEEYIEGHDFTVYDAKSMRKKLKETRRYVRDLFDWVPTYSDELFDALDELVRNVDDFQELISSLSDFDDWLKRVLDGNEEGRFQSR